MKSKSIYIVLFFLLFIVFIKAQPSKVKAANSYNSYFPVNKNVTLVYESSFGESISNYFQDGQFIISSSEGDDFEYKQTLLIKEEGIYVKEIYQYLKIFLFIKKEATFTYGKPLLRFPLPLSPGMNWEWEGAEHSNENINTVKVTGKTFDKEFIITKAGRFETIKLESIIESSDDAKNIVTEWFAADIGLIKAKIIIEGGGLMGFLRDLLGYGTIEFELKEIRKQ